MLKGETEGMTRENGQRPDTNLGPLQGNQAPVHGLPALPTVLYGGPQMHGIITLQLELYIAIDLG